VAVKRNNIHRISDQATTRKLMASSTALQPGMARE